MARVFLLLLLLLGLGTWIHADITDCTTPFSEVSALQALYTSTSGDTWHWRTPYSFYGYPWNFTATANPCDQSKSWQGITCEQHGSTCNVLGIDLGSYDLRGVLPKELGALSALQVIHLDNNVLTGSIPSEIGALTALQDLYLQVNRLSGTLPSTMSQLQQLQYVEMGNNRLNGTLDGVGEWTVLKYLSLDHNFFTGSLPDTMAALTAMQSFDVHKNLLTGPVPTWIGNWTQLEYFDVDGNLLTGTIPSQWGNLTKLLNLYLNANRLTGTLPVQLAQLRSLETLALDNNRLNGSIPVAFGQLTQLKYLSLSNNKLSGSLFPELGQLSALQSLYLGSNHLTGPLPRQLGQLTVVEYLDVSENRFTGPLPVDIGQMTKLSNLCMQANLLTGPLPSQLCSTAIGDIFAAGNLFSGELPACFAKFSQLSLADNRLNGSLDAQFFGAALVSCSLSHNALTGRIPAVPAHSPLLYLELQHNRLNGTVALASQRLLSLNVANNALTGPFPWANASRSLQYLNVSDNRLTGTVPAAPDASFLHALSIDASFNGLSGQLSDAFSQAANLTYLRLAYNAFTGPVDALVNTSLQAQLSSIDLMYNRLSGSLPASWFALPQLAVLLAASNCFDEAVPADVCGAKNLTTLVLDGMGSDLACNRRLLPWSPADIYSLTSLGQQAPPFPACVFTELPRLHTLHLSGLGLAGDLSSVTQLPATLVSLSLSYNQLDGTIPAAFFTHPEWNELDLSFNRLRGHLAALANGSRDAALNLQINHLSGAVPPTVQALADVNILNGNLFTCPYDSAAQNHAGLPAADPNAASYRCGSNEMDLILYSWMACLAAAALVAASIHHWWYDLSPLWSLFDDLRSRPRGHRVYDRFVRSAAAWLAEIVTLLVFSVVVCGPLFAVLKRWYDVYEDQYLWTLSAGFLSGSVPAAVLYWLVIAFVGHFLYRRRLLRDGDATSAVERTTDAAKTGHVDVDRRQLAWFIGASTLLSGIVLTVNGIYVYLLQYSISASSATLLAVAVSLVKLASNQLCLWLASRVPSSPTVVSSLIAFLSFNSIVAPYLIEGFVSTSCFYYATIAAVPVVSSTVRLPTCVAVLNPDIYKFESQFDAVVFQCYPLSFVLSYQPPFVYSFNCSSTLLATFAPVYALRYMWSGVVQPLLQFFVDRWLRRARTSSQWTALLETAQIPHWRLIRRLHGMASTADCEAAIAQSAVRDLWDQQKFTAPLVADLLVLLTFGVSFPPLSLLVAWSMCASVVDHWLFLRELLRYCPVEKAAAAVGDNPIEAQSSPRADLIARQLQAVEVGISFAEDLVRRLELPLLTLVAMFWAFTLFDTVGDVRGGGGVATVVMTVAAPTLLVLGAEAWRRRCRIAGLRSADDATNRQGDEVSGAISTEDIEMTTASSQTEEIITINPMAAGVSSSS